MPEVKNKKKQTCPLKLKAVTPKKKARVSLIQVEEIEDEDGMCNLAQSNSGVS